MKILITGGHVTPALALIDKLEGYEIIFVGRKYALENEQILSLEYKEITQKNIKFVDIQAGRITRLLSAKTFWSVFKIPLGFYQGFKIVREEKPDILLSFGSYIAVPIVFWAWLFKIPIFTHEQANIPGLANRLIGKMAKKVFTSFPETSAYFEKNKTVLTGNPVRESVKKIVKKPFEIESQKPIIFITGGSLGSHSINLHISKIVKELVASFTVIHQTGDTKEYDDYSKLIRLKKSLPSKLQKKYHIQKHFMESEMGYVYSVSDLVVARAGANTFFELLVLDKPTIFIPLPWSANKEQQKHAQLFKDAGVGEIFNQSAESKELLNLIKKIFINLDQYKRNFKNLKYLYKQDASEIISQELFKK